MSQIKREMDRLDGIRISIVNIAVEQDAIEYDDENSEVSPLDTDSFGDVRRLAYTARKRGEIDATKEEVTAALDEIVPRDGSWPTLHLLNP